MIVKKIAIIEGKRFIRFLFDPSIHYSVCRGDGNNRCSHWEEPNSKSRCVCEICDSIYKRIKGLRSTRKVRHYTYYGK